VSGKPIPFRETAALLDPETTKAVAEITGRVTSPAAFRPCTAEDLLLRDFPPREVLLAPFIAKKTLTMMYARRGAGKTWVAEGIALAVASGGVVFDARSAAPAWSAPSPREVLLVDGEMPGSMIRDRLALLIAGRRYHPGGRLRVLAADLFDEPLPSISTPEGRAIVDAHLGEAQLVIFDNISTLFRGLDENDAGEWEPVQDYLLSLRRRGLAVLLVHHSGKAGAQRGTSKREDVLDFVVNLKLPDDHLEDEGARVHVVFEKTRGLAGRDVESFEAKLTVTKTAAVWEASPLTDPDDDVILKLHRAGKTQREIASKVGKDQASVSRRLRRLTGTPGGDA
jgi:putative DNA primase/helicase